MAKLAAILRATEGWDAPWSQPADRDAVANYSAWFSTVAPGRELDAEPMLTDEGNVRLEWDRDGYDYTAEIGSASMWLCVLAPRASDDAEVDVAFDEAVLSRFFHDGVLPVGD